MDERAALSSRQAADTAEAGPGEQTRRRTLATALIAALLGAGVWFLIGQAASYSKLLHAISRAHPWWLAAAVAAAMSAYLGYALLYRSVVGLADGPRPRMGLTLRLTVAVFGASVIATSAGRLGSEYWTLRRMRERPPQAWSRVLAINTAQWALLATLACTGALALLLGAGGRAPLGLELAWLLALPLCTIPAIYLTSPARRSLAEDRGIPIRRTFAAALRGIILLRALAARPRALSRGAPGGLLYWTGELLTVWAALHAFGISIGFPSLVVGYATGYVSTMLPLPAGGAGGVDAASTYALTLVGVPLGPALLATLVQRLCTYWLPLAVALLASPALRRLRTDLPAVPRPSSPRGAWRS
jgi:uncharacterized membrane protein YbhN (UPF0104 family)